MKLLICGKGGSGKSTITALLAKNLETHGRRVLVVDADESNYGLSAQLGIAEPVEFMEHIGGKKALKNKMGRVVDGHKAAVFDQNWRIEDIPPESLSRKGNVYLLQIGKVKHFDEGCACPMGVLSKDFLNHLTLAPKDLVIVDTEAGVEHLGRGVAEAVDLIVGIVDPSYESIRLSKKIASMATESKKQVHFVINKADGAVAEKIVAQIGKENVIAVVPFSSTVQEKGLLGEALDDKMLDVTAVTRFILKSCADKN